MAYDLFISYSKDDFAAATRLCELLEKDGFVCWIAPRDIPVGATWAGAIFQAIQESRAMVLVISRHATESKQISREVELADEHSVPIMPVRLEPVELKADYAYYLSNRQWFDCYPDPLDSHVPALSRALRHALAQKQPAASAFAAGPAASTAVAAAAAAPRLEQPADGASAPQPNAARHRMLLGGGMAAVVLAAAGGYALLRNGNHPAPHPGPAPIQQGASGMVAVDPGAGASWTARLEMTPTDFDNQANLLRRTGYHIARYRQLDAGPGARVMALWQKGDGAFEKGIAKGDAREAVRKIRARNRVPISISGYMENGQPQYAIAHQPRSDGGDFRVEFGMSESEYQAMLDKHKGLGFTPATVSVSLLEGHAEWSGTWRKLPQNPAASVQTSLAADSIDAALGKLGAGYAPAGLAPFSTESGARYTLLALASSAHERRIFEPALSAAEFRSKALDLAKQGLQPIELSAFTAGKELRYAAVWAASPAP